MTELPHGALDAKVLLAEGRALRALARSLVGDADADDVVHEGFVAALRQPDGVRDGGAWLAGAVRKLALRWRRGEGRRRAREQHVVRHDTHDAADPARIAAQAEALHAVARAVHELDEPFRTAVVLRFWNDLPARTIAARLGVPHETVRSRLQRGLARLRERLDGERGGRAAWTGALGALAPAKQAASAAAPAAALGAAGLLMNTKLLLGGVSVLAAAFAIAAVWPDPEAQHAPAAANAFASAAPAASRDDGWHDPSLVRDEVAGPGEVPVASVGAIAPWQLRVHVVDGNDRPLDGARVLVRRAPTGTENRTELSRPDDPPFATLHTDVLGDAETTIADDHVAVRAEIGDATSLEHFVYRSGVAIDGVSALRPVGATLRIESPVVLTGRVVRRDGSPATGAVVTATQAAGNGEGDAPTRIAEADAAGAFALRVPPRCTYNVQAALDGATTFPLVRRTHAPDPPPALLTFAGATSIRGTVVDADGMPMPGASIRVWHADWRADAVDEENLWLHADERGCFVADVARARRYGVLASASGHAPSDMLVVEPTAERPHIDVVVRLCAFASIAGAVLRPDGSAFANARVYTTTPWRSEPWDPEPKRHERYPTGGDVRTDEAGRFTLRVHPGIRWTIVVCPRADGVDVRREDVVPGTTDCTFILDDNDLRGCTIVATFRAPAGTTWPICTLVVEDADGVSTQTLRARGSDFSPAAHQPTENDPRVRFAPVGVHRTIVLRVLPPERSGLAPLRIPLRTIPGELHVDVPLRPFATVDVRVVFELGRPARPIWVRAALADGEHSREPLQADGTARLLRCCPGDNTLTIAEEGKLDGPREGLLWQQPITLVPGENPAIVVTVPAAKAPR